MNLKVLAAAVALLAICAEARTIGSDGGDLADFSDEDLGLELQALSAGLGDESRLDPVSQAVDGFLKAIQGAVKSVQGAFEAATHAVQEAVDNALAAARGAAQAASDGWNKALQDLMNVNQAVDECRKGQPSLQSVHDELNQDVQACVRNASASANSTLSGLQTLSAKAQELAQAAQQDLDDCRSGGFWGLFGCFSRLVQRSVNLARDAGMLFAKITGDLVVRIPVQSAACVADAVNKRNAEATVIIDAVRACVRASTPTSTPLQKTPTMQL